MQSASLISSLRRQTRQCHDLIWVRSLASISSRDIYPGFYSNVAVVSIAHMAIFFTVEAYLSFVLGYPLSYCRSFDTAYNHISMIAHHTYRDE
jgi:hypothetical protein